MSIPPQSHHNSDDVKLSDIVLADIQSEVDLEISLRDELAKTLEARIEWGRMLQTALSNGYGATSQEIFRSIALGTLSSLETRSLYILGSDPAPPPNIAAQPSRPSPKKLYPGLKPKPAFLFTRYNPAARQDYGSHNCLYILKCPSCSKTAFTSLQGLLNHARLMHNLEWGTHDECIRACAVIDNYLDVNAGTEVGIGPLGILPGLQTIFQNAVSSQIRDIVDVPAETNSVELTEPTPAASLEGDYLNKTLGLHEDSAALAPYLGKEAIRRQIKVWDEDVDIEPYDSLVEIHDNARFKRRALWRMPFSQRHFKEVPDLNSEEISKTAKIPDAGEQSAELRISNEEVALPPPSELIVASASRFCLIARIVITDRSLSLPKGIHHNQNYTHKWMVSVDAPAYAHHITSVLQSIEVSPVDPNSIIPCPPPTSAPPFLVVGVSNKPFLAKVQLTFVGTSVDESSPGQKVIFEHWVDLDPIGDRGVVAGQDQVLDVELDKHTVLRPPLSGYPPIDSKIHWNSTFLAPETQKKAINLAEPSVVSTILNRLAKIFPMTQGGRVQSSSAAYPYRLVPNRSYFKNLVIGRRKAIEFGRARAIQQAYNAEIENLPDTSLHPLSVAEVYSWLLENRHFIRTQGNDVKEPFVRQERSVKKEDAEHEKYSEVSRWCAMCGLDTSRHPAPNDDNIKMENTGESKSPLRNRKFDGLSMLAPDDSCPVVHRSLQIIKLPAINMELLSVDGRAGLHHSSVGSVAMPPQTLVTTANPHLTLHICHLLSKLGPHLAPTINDIVIPRFMPAYPVDDLGSHKPAIQTSLASSALLALATTSFLRTVLERGLEVAHRDKVTVTGLSSTSRSRKNGRKVSELSSAPNCLLTPTHILSGILTCGRGRGSAHDPLDAIVLSCLSRLGVGITSSSPIRDENHPQVKVEE